MIVNKTVPYTCDNLPFIAQRTDQYIKKGGIYRLYDFLWQPFVINDEWSNDGRAKMLEAWKKLKKPKQIPLDMK